MCNKIVGYTHSQFQQLSSDQSDSEINGMTGTTGVPLPDGPSNNSITLTTSNCDYIDTQHKCTESTSVTLNIQENPELSRWVATEAAGRAAREDL